MGGGAGSARVTLAPASTAELVAIIRDAVAAGRPLRFEGGGRWSGPGTPAARTRADAQPVSLARYSGVAAYVPADFTLTVRAGTTLRELAAVTAEHNQWCPLLAWGDDEGTVGATFATATHGPCSAALGRPRDLALGAEFVDGTGAVVRGGGRVVKNVAGFDLTRLVVGSFGAFGVITEVSVRLRVRPAVDATWCVAARDGSHGGSRDERRDAGSIARALRRGAIAPVACEPLDARASAALGLEPEAVLVRFAGNRALVDAARADVARDFRVGDADPAAWSAFRALDPYPRAGAGDALASVVARRIKERFDPAHIMNPGVLGEPA
jgi:glycolate oxidase FAD binding subunit